MGPLANKLGPGSCMQCLPQTIYMQENDHIHSLWTRGTECWTGHVCQLRCMVKLHEKVVDRPRLQVRMYK